MTQVAVLLAKAETTDGTDSVPVIASNAILVNEPLDPNGSFAFRHARDKLIVGAAVQSSPPLVAKGRMANWQNTLNVRGNNTTVAYSASVLPEIHPFMIAAGYAAVVVTTGGAETVTYKPAATALLGASEYYYVDGKLYKILGAKADVDFAFDAGGPVVASLKRTGLYQAPSDAAVPTIVSSSYGTAIPPVADAISLTVSAFAAGIIRKASVTSGNQIAQRANANAAGGLATYRVRSRKMGWSVVLEDETIATKDFEALELANTAFSLSFTVGTVQYNKVTFTLANCRLESTAKSDDNGTQLITLSGGAYDSVAAANDAVSVLFN